MRAVIQRASAGSVRVDGEVVGAVGLGLVVLLGVARGDGETMLERLGRLLQAA